MNQAAVDAVGRDRRVPRRRDVGSGETQALAATIATHHHALDAVWPSERFGRGDDVTRIDAGSDVGRGEGDRPVPVLIKVVFSHQRHALDREAEAFACLAQHADVAARLLAEREVLTDHDLHDVQALDQQFVDVPLGRELHEVRGERHDEEDVDTHFLNEFGPPGQGGQLSGVAAGKDHFHRMWVECHQHRRHAARSTRLHRVVDQFGVPAVDTVEHTDGDDTSAPVRGDLILAPPALHNGKPTTRQGRWRQ